jgi:hypothetical protein
MPSIDESERTFSPEEKRIAEILKNEGKNIKAKAEVPGERTADAEVDGVESEFKSLSPGAKNSTVRNSINNSIRRGGQSRDMIIDARGSGLTKVEAQRGLARAKNIARGKIDSVRIIGDSFDITAVGFK